MVATRRRALRALRAVGRLTFSDVLPELRAVSRNNRNAGRSQGGGNRRLKFWRRLPSPNGIVILFRRWVLRQSLEGESSTSSERVHQKKKSTLEGPRDHDGSSAADLPEHDDLFEVFGTFRDKPVKMPLARAILSSRKRECMWTAVLCTIADVGWVLIPTLLHFINRFAKRQHYTRYSPAEQESLRDGGFGFAIGLLCLQTLQYICATHVDYRLDMIGARLRTTVSKHLLEIRLRHPNACVDEAKHDAKVEAVAIEDLAEEVADGAISAHRVWTLPFAVVVGCVILIKRLEAASVAGLAVLLVGTPLVAKLAVICKHRLSRADEREQERRRQMLQLVSPRGVRKGAQGAPPGEDDQRAIIDDVCCLRDEELGSTRALRSGELACQVTIANLPNIGAAVSMCVLQVQNRLNSTTIVLTLTSFHAMRIVMSQWPRAIAHAHGGWHACRKVAEMLANIAPEEDQDRAAEAKGDVQLKQVAVRLHDAAWVAPPTPRSGPMLGNDATQPCVPPSASALFTADRAELVAIAPQSPDAARSVVSTLLGHRQRRTASATLSAPPAYCPSTPWMVSDTIRQNILFSEDYVEERYREVLAACHLSGDIEHLQQGDGTLASSVDDDVQQRISLARALYSTSPIVIVDRFPFQQQGNLFRDAMQSFQPDRCRIVIIVDYDVAKQCDRVVELSSEGSISHAVEGSGGTSPSEESTASPVIDSEKILAFNEKLSPARRTTAFHENIESAASATIASDLNQPKAELRAGAREKPRRKKDDAQPDPKNKAQTKSGWRAYFGAANSYWMIAALIVPYLFSTAGGLLVSFWALRASLLLGGRYISPYAHIGGIIGLVFWHGTSQFVYLFFAIIIVGERAGRNLHKEAITGLAKLPQKARRRQTPTQVVHRFMMDVDIAAIRAPQTMSRFSLTVGMVVVSFALTGGIMPYLLALIVPALGLAIYFCSKILPHFMQLQRIQRQEKSTEHEAVAEALAGSSVIHAFNYEAQYLRKIQKLQQQHHRTEKLKSKAGEWLTMRLTCLSSLVLFASCASIVGQSSTPLLAGAVLIHLYIATRSASRAGHQYLGVRRGLMAVKRLADLGATTRPAKQSGRKAKRAASDDEKSGDGQVSQSTESHDADSPRE